MQAKPSTSEEFLSRYPGEAARIESAYRSLVVKTEKAIRGRKDRQVVAYMANGDFVRFDLLGVSHVASPSRTFIVGPTGDHGEFVLRQIGVTPEAYEKGLNQTRLRCELIHFPFSFYERPLVEIVRGQLVDFKFKSIQGETFEGTTCFSVTYDQSFPDGVVRTISFCFPVDPPWIVLKQTISVGKDSTIAVVKYEGAASGVPLPNSLTFSTAVDGKVVSEDYTIKTIDLKKESPPISEFKLEHFGIEDTFGAELNSNTLWVLACAVVCLVLAVLIRRKLRND